MGNRDKKKPGSLQPGHNGHNLEALYSNKSHLTFFWVLWATHKPLFQVHRPGPISQSRWVTCQIHTPHSPLTDTHQALLTQPEELLDLLRQEKLRTAHGTANLL